MGQRTDENVQKDIYAYRRYLQARESKYRRNWNRYVNNGTRSDSIWQLYGMPLAYAYEMSDVDTGILPVINVIRSAIETHVSKISQTKVRPFFNPVNGDYETYKVAENAQVFFDNYYQEENVYKKATEALRDAEIFEFGVLWIDELDVKIKRVGPWQFYYDPAEYNYDKQFSRVFLEFRDYPVSILSRSETGKYLTDDVLSAWENAPEYKVKYNVFYDLVNKERIEIVNDKVIHRYALASDILPFEIIFYSNPVKGGFSTSLVDNLLPIQSQIDTLSHRIHLAAELNPANAIFIPQGSFGSDETIKRSAINNRIGNIYEYDASVPGAGAPVVSTPRFIDPQYLAMLQFWIATGLEMEGISQLSAMSKKPSGLDSGKALDTYNDAESERHNVILNSYIRFLMGIALKMIDIFPDDGLVIPSRRGVKAITWKQVKKARKNLELQFGQSSVLSNDPSTKMEQIEKMISMGRLTQPEATKLLEFPDTNGMYNILNASYDDCQAIIQRAIEDEDYNYYEIVNTQELFSEIQKMILRLDANNERPEVIARLNTLLTKVSRQMDEFNKTINNASAPPVVNAPAPAPEPTPVQDLSMNGAQITAIADIVAKVQAQLITPVSAKALITAGFPNTPMQLIDAMVGIMPLDVGAPAMPPVSAPVPTSEPGPTVQ